MVLLSVDIFFKISLFVVVVFFQKIYFGNISRVSSSLDSDHARCFVRLDLGPNCLQRHWKVKFMMTIHAN